MLERPARRFAQHPAVALALVSSLAACAAGPAAPVGGVIAKPVGLAAAKACYAALPDVPGGEAVLFMATVGCPIVGVVSGLAAETATVGVVVAGSAAALGAADGKQQQAAPISRTTSDEFLRTGVPSSVPLSPAQQAEADAAFREGHALAEAADPSAWSALCRAADLGHARARMELAHWHRTDMQLLNESPGFRASLARDDLIAFMWFRLAEADQAWGARASVDALSGRLNATQRAAADQMARDWRPGHCPVGPAESLQMVNSVVAVP